MIKIIYKAGDVAAKPDTPTMIEWLDHHVGKDNYETLYDYRHRAFSLSKGSINSTYAIDYHFRYEQDAILFKLRWA